jgi:hypothetical protein
LQFHAVDPAQLLHQRYSHVCLVLPMPQAAYGPR